MSSQEYISPAIRWHWLLASLQLRTQYWSTAMFGRECLAYLSDPPVVISWSYTASTTVWLSFSRTLWPSCNPSFVPHY